MTLKLDPESEALLARAFARLDEVTTGKVLMTALVAGALEIQNAAKVNAPAVTGTLRRSIHIGGHSYLNGDFNPGEGYSDIGGAVEEPEHAKVLIGSNLAYARRIEYGFVGTDTLGRVYHQGPRPYLRPAFDTQQGAAQRTIEASLQILLDGI